MGREADETERNKGHFHGKGPMQNDGIDVKSKKEQNFGLAKVDTENLGRGRPIIGCVEPRFSGGRITYFTASF